ncbi:MAG: LytR C-terminal domain-containing protein [Microgenomates group bacterium]
MIYLSINQNTIKLLSFKKTLLGQEETVFFEKTYEAKLTDKGKPINIDLLASAVKEVITSAFTKNHQDKDVFLILPQEAFVYLRMEVPSDIAPSALNSFINDKIRSSLPVLTEELVSDYFVKINDQQKVVNFFGISKEIIEDYQQAFSLIDLKLVSILPETLAYFKLFEKTLRADKKEIILYVNIENNLLTGYLFDNFGLVDEKNFVAQISQDNTPEKIIKEISKQLETENKKPNRLIISGNQSENIRQDTFTKTVGIWTNPLKRIIPNFYQSYLKSIIVDQNKPFSILKFDACFGAYVFNREEKFSLNKKLGKNSQSIRTTINDNSFSSPKIYLPKKEIFLFLSSFVLSFFLFIFINNFKSTKLSFFSKKITPTVTPLPTITPSPTPTIKKEELKIQVLNGSGIPGKASEMKEILKKKGYQEIITGNADNYDYKLTEIQVKRSKSFVAELIKNDLSDYFSTIKITTLAEEKTPDVIIIIGADFK